MLCPPEQVPELLEVKDIPVVVVDLHHQAPPGLRRVGINAHMLGQRAAEYFLHCRYRNFTVSMHPPRAATRFSAYRITVNNAEQTAFSLPNSSIRVTTTG